MSKGRFENKIMLTMKFAKTKIKVSKLVLFLLKLLLSFLLGSFSIFLFKLRENIIEIDSHSNYFLKDYVYAKYFSSKCCLKLIVFMRNLTLYHQLIPITCFNPRLLKRIIEILTK